MDYSFVGYVIGALGVIVSLFLAVYKPLSKIEQRLTKIETKLEDIDKTLNGHSRTLDKHEERLDEHDIAIATLTNNNKGEK